MDLIFRCNDAIGRFDMVANETVTEGANTGVLPGMESWGLALGNPFAEYKTLDGEIEHLVLQAGDGNQYD